MNAYATVVLTLVGIAFILMILWLFLLQFNNKFAVNIRNFIDNLIGACLNSTG